MNKCVVITGATSGFGLASAKLFAKNGWSLVLTGRRAERLESIKSELEELTSVHTCTLDIRDADAIINAIDNIPEDFQNVTALVNNAGLALGTDPSYDAKLSDWQTMIDTNITGLVHMTHALLPRMMDKKGASIINLASVASNWPYPGSHVYGASKAFVAQFSRNLRCDVAGKNVRVTSLEPGLSESEFSLVRFNGDQEKYDQLYNAAKALQPEDIADIIYWIASQPAHININSLEVMPTSQAWNTFNVVKNTN